METQGINEQSLSNGESKAFCKCSDGWTCVITKTEGPDAGKAFFKCGENCTCVIEGDGTVVQDTRVEQEFNVGKSKAFCKCGPGWSCVISKVEGPDAGKAFFECAGECTCTTAT